MITAQLTELLENQVSQGLPFVLYAAPDTSKVTVMLQKTIEDDNRDFQGESGFVFAPFSEGKTRFIPSKNSERFDVAISEERMGTSLEIVMPVDTEERNDYESLVQKAVDAINEEGLSKIVTSRKMTLAVAKFSLETLISRLFTSASNAFRYIWFHPETNFWFGATPEVLLTSEKNSFMTMALAGTRSLTPDIEPAWTAKERLEQQWVAEDIGNRLERSAAILKVEKIKNHFAGNVVHLRTDFSGTFRKGQNANIVAGNLHPTPAVCGTPREDAFRFITKNELYQRTYYTGYLGPVDAENKKSSFYVNLRCGSFDNDKVHLYAGGGITFASVPKDEWEETQKKLQAMLEVLSPML